MTYPIGAFFLTAIGPPTGWWIGVGQALAGAPSRYEHAGIVIDGDGTVVEAEPGGARIGHLSTHAGRPLLVSDAPVQQWMSGYDVLNADIRWAESVRREMIVKEARALLGTPYSFLDYLALAALHLHLPSDRLRQYVQDSGHLICSALVDRAYERAGIQIFNDGRMNGDVMPSDLAAFAEDHQEAWR